jgi:hypothetical protein
VHHQELYVRNLNLVNLYAEVQQLCVWPTRPGHNSP